MKFLSNTHDPKDKYASRYVLPMPNETHAEAWAHHLEWLRGKIIGDPRPTDSYTIEELKAMNMVGVYSHQ